MAQASTTTPPAVRPGASMPSQECGRRPRQSSDSPIIGPTAGEPPPVAAK